MGQIVWVEPKELGKPPRVFLGYNGGPGREYGIGLSPIGWLAVAVALVILL